jgi:uncharacterized DUF497 family protein
VRIVRGDYEWDSVKADSNERKHGVTFDEGVTALRDPFASEATDISHPKRMQAICLSHPRGRLLLVVYEPRGWRTRIISARPVDGRERKTYEEGG